MTATVWWVFVGGGLGALTRWGVAVSAGRWLTTSFPVGTFVVNVAGCFLMGLLGELFATRLELPSSLKLGATTGFLGGLTTFSTFGYETVRLVEAGGPGTSVAILSVAANVVIGVAACLAGVAVGVRLS